MKPLATFVAVMAATILLGAATAAQAQVKLPPPGGPGSSPDTAVRLVVTSEVMVDRQIRSWLRAHYPGWHADPHQMMELGFERYAVVFISTSDQPGRRVYFRVMRHQNEDEVPFPDMP
jgi:hypothetical protein